MNAIEWEQLVVYGRLDREGAALLIALLLASLFSFSTDWKKAPFLLFSFVGLGLACCASSPWAALSGLGLTLIARTFDIGTPKGVWILIASLLLTAGGYSWGALSGELFGSSLACIGLLTFGGSLSLGALPSRTLWNSAFPLSAAWLLLIKLLGPGSPLLQEKWFLFSLGALCLAHSTFLFQKDRKDAPWAFLLPNAYWMSAFCLAAGSHEASAGWWIGTVFWLASAQVWRESETTPVHPAGKVYWILWALIGVGLPLFLMGHAGALIAKDWHEGSTSSILWILIQGLFGAGIGRIFFSVLSSNPGIPNARRPLIGSFFLLLLISLLFWRGPEWEFVPLPLWGTLSGEEFGWESVSSLLAIALALVIAWLTKNVEGITLKKPNLEKEISLFQAGARSVEGALEEILWKKGVLNSFSFIFDLFAKTLYRIGESTFRFSSLVVRGAGKGILVPIRLFHTYDPQIALLLGSSWILIFLLLLWKG